MGRAFVHVNGVDYELAAPYSKDQVDQLAARLRAGGDPQTDTVLIDGEQVSLTFDTSKVWVSGGWIKASPESVLAQFPG